MKLYVPFAEYEPETKRSEVSRSWIEWLVHGCDQWYFNNSDEYGEYCGDFCLEGQSDQNEYDAPGF